MGKFVQNNVPSAGVIVLRNGASVDTTLPKFGAGSLFLDGDKQSALWSDVGRAEVGSSDFTLELFCMLTAIPSLGVIIVNKRRDAASYGSFALIISEARVPAIFITNDNTSWFASVGTSPLPLNVRCFDDGIESCSLSFSGAVPTNVYPMTFGGSYENDQTFGTRGFPGRIDSIRFTVGASRYNSNFTPPSSEFGTSIIDDALWNNVVLLAKFDEAAEVDTRSSGTINRKIEYPLPTFSARGVERIQMPYRVYNGGRGKIYGTVKIKGTPTVPTSRAVRLFRDIDSMCLAETWSDPVTGYYEFIGFDLSQKYTVVAIDYQNNYRAVIADNLTAETA
jgi:hypothetical protein